MNGDTEVKLGMMLGLVSHPQTVIDDLWAQAQAALGGEARRLSAVVVYIDDGTHHVVPRGNSMQLVGLKEKTQGGACRNGAKIQRSGFNCRNNRTVAQG